MPYQLQWTLPNGSEAKPRRPAENLRYSKERSRRLRHRWGGSFACGHVEQVEPGRAAGKRQCGGQEPEQGSESESVTEPEQEQEGGKRR